MGFVTDRVRHRCGAGVDRLVGQQYRLTRAVPAFGVADVTREQLHDSSPPTRRSGHEPSMIAFASDFRRCSWNDAACSAAHRICR